MNESPRVLGNRYEIGDLLGRGGMAEVHLGRDARLGREVAIKLLRTDLARDPTFQARFRREAQSAASLNHPSIVSVYDTGEETVADINGGTVGLPYIVMEHVRGRTLRDLVETARARAGTELPYGSAPVAPGALDIDFALEVTSGVLSALEYSHRAGIVHRDIKPANVMVTPNGDVKVMDFGIARALADASAAMTQTQAVIGTAQYLSPEQARGEAVDARSDLYSTGCLLFELLTGRPPFVADSPVAVAYQHVREFPPLPSSINPRVPEAVDRIVMHALTKDRDIRYQTAAEFQEDVESARAGRRVAAPLVTGQAAIATEYIPPSAQATRAMGAAAVGVGIGSMLPGAPPSTDDQAVGGYQSYPPRRSEQRKGRAVGWAIAVVVGLALLVSVGFLLASLRGPAGPASVVVPSVVGQQQPVAEAALRAKGLIPKVTTAADDSVPTGVVISQLPEADQSVKEGSAVALVVSAGPNAVVIPNIQGMTQSQARDALAAKGLTVGTVAQSSDSKYDAGLVDHTAPDIGQPAAPGDAIDLWVSDGLVTVPDVRGLSRSKAESTLTAKGLKVSTHSQTSDKPAGTVIAQDTQSGAKLTRGSVVTITIATAPVPPPTTPSPTVTTPPPTPSTTTPTP